MSVLYRSGGMGYCDVASTPQGFAFVYEVGDAVVCEFVHTFRTLVPEPMMFLRAAYVPAWQEVVAIAQGHDSGKAWLIRRSGLQDLGLTFGVQPVCVDADFAYVVRSGQQYDAIRLANGVVSSFPHPLNGSSQGIRQVVDGEIVWADETHIDNITGLAVHEYSEVGAVVAGQADPPQVIGVYLSDGFAPRPFTAIQGEAYEPHVAQIGVQYAICARTPKGAAYIVVPPFPPFISGQPQPQPDPQPQPEPDLPPVTNMAIYDTLKAVRAKYPARNLTREQLGALLNEVAWIHKDVPCYLYPKVGGSTAVQPHTGKTISSDILLTREEGVLVWRDVLNDAEGIAEPQWPAPMPANPHEFLVPVEPDGVEPEPEPPADHGEELAELRKYLDAELLDISLSLDELSRRIKALEDKPAPALPPDVVRLNYPVRVPLTWARVLSGTIEKP